MNEEIMNKVIEKCLEDQKYAQAFDHLMKAAQMAALSGFTNEEMANVCIMGWIVGTDPELGEMIKNMARINNLGLDIVDD